MKRYGTVVFLLLICILLLGAAPILPTVDFYINDGAGLLSSEQKSTVLTASTGLEQQSGTQLVLLTLPSLSEQGYSNLQAFADDVFTTWQIGGREAENGVLIVAVQEPSACMIRIGKTFSGSITAAQIQEATQRATASMEQGDAAKSVMDLYSALFLRVYEILELEPPQLNLEASAKSSRAPYLLLGGIFLVVARSYRVSLKYGSRYGKGHVHKRRHFVRKSSDETAGKFSVPELYNRIGREDLDDNRTPQPPENGKE